MEGSVKELSRYRLSQAKEDLDTARILYREKQFKASINRSYYSIFHALRSVTALDHFDSSKHSGIIAYINKNYVRTEIFDKSFSKILDTAFRMREKADYQDFFIASREMAEEQISKAETVLETIEKYLDKKI